MARSLDLPYRLRVLEEPHRGLAATRNRGAAAAQLPIVVFLDDDIRPAPGFLGAHAAAHAEAPTDHLALGYYPPAVRGGDLNAMAVRRWWTDHFRLLSDSGHRWRFPDVCDGNASIPVRLFDAVGRLDEDFTGRRQDWDFGVRVLRGGVPIRFYPDAIGWHHFDPSVETSLRHSRQEALDDVLLASKHPGVVAALPLAALADGRLDRLAVGRGVLPRAAAHGAWRQAAARALAALEAANLRGRWSRLMGRLLTLSYAGGVIDALPDPAARAALLDSSSWPRQELEIDLEKPGPPLDPDGVLMPRIGIIHRGRRIAAVDAVSPGGQWDVEALLDRLVAAVTVQGALPWVMPPATVDRVRRVASPPA